MNKFCGMAFALGLSLMSTSAVGGIHPGYDALVTSPSETKVFVGLNWSFGGSATPELILGMSNGRTRADGNVQGSKISAHFDLGSGFTPSKVKATAVFGQASAMAELGAGYDVLGGELIGVVGLNTGNLAVGIDVNMDMELSPYAGFHTIGAFPGTGLTCDGLPDTHPLNSDYSLVGLSDESLYGEIYPYCVYETPG